MQFPEHVHELKPEHYEIAGVPTYLHTEWDTYDQIPPKGALCATIGRINAGEVEFFVGDGVHPYTQLGKFGTSMDAVSTALALKDTACYTDKFEISRTGFPISSLESIRVLDPASGRYTVVSTVEAVIAANGLAFTHPDLSTGDIVEAVYLWSYAGVLGENTYGYLKDPLVAYDTTGEKYYKIFPTVSAGTLEWDKTEIVVS